MDKVNSGETPWTTVETIYRRRLEELLVTYGITVLTTGEIDTLARAWWRSGRGPTRSGHSASEASIHRHAPVPMRSFIGMVELARFAGLPWDCIITAENAR